MISDEIRRDGAKAMRNEAYWTGTGVEDAGGRHRRRVDPLEDELRHTVPPLDGKIGLRVVKQEDADVAAVIGVDDAGTNVDEALPRQPGARGCGWRAMVRSERVTMG